MTPHEWKDYYHCLVARKLKAALKYAAEKSEAPKRLTKTELRKLLDAVNVTAAETLMEIAGEEKKAVEYSEGLYAVCEG